MTKSTSSQNMGSKFMKTQPHFSPDKPEEVITIKAKHSSSMNRNNVGPAAKKQLMDLRSRKTDSNLVAKMAVQKQASNK